MTPGVRKHFQKVLNDKAFRYRVEKWFWILNIPGVLYLFFWHPEFWDKISVLYLALVSVYALVLTAGGAEQAAEAAAEAAKD
jgi:hypothetical protein